MSVLEDFAVVRLGYKSLLNDFFYVTRDTIDRFGIEKEFLKPLYQLADLDANKYWQTGKPQRWLFWCRKIPADVKGTGAGAYIAWAGDQKTAERKQSGGQVTWKEAPALSGHKHWYWPPAPTHPTRIALRKGVGARYAPFLFKQPAVLDQRLYIVSPKQGVSGELLAAFLSSSLFPLALETNADMGLGAGVLTIGANNLRRLPCIDLGAVSSHPKVDVVLSAAETLYKKKPPDAGELPSRKDVRELDEAFLACLDLSAKRAKELEERVTRLQALRVERAKSREKRRVETSKADLDAATKDIVEALQAWLRPRRFPEDWTDDKHPWTQVDLPSGQLTAQIDLVMGQASLQVRTSSGTVALEQSDDDSVIEVTLRAMQMGRRSFTTPTTSAGAKAALKGLKAMLEGYEALLSDLLAKSSPGPRYDSQVRARVAEATGIDPAALRQPLAPGELRLLDP